MNRWSASFLRVVFAFVIVLLGVAASFLPRAILHTQSDRITGIAFLIAVVCLVLTFERVFPSVYPRSPTPQWWQLRAVWVVVFGIIVSILSSRVASLWFGLTVVGSVLVALLLRARRSSELQLRSAGDEVMFWTKKMFSSAGDVVVDVRDVAATQRWYSEKLGLSYSSPDAEEATLELGYSADSILVYLVEVCGDERPNQSPGKPPIMFARKLADAHEHLSSRGVDVGPIQNDSGGNQFFRFRDLEGNELEVCQEHQTHQVLTNRVTAEVVLARRWKVTRTNQAAWAALGLPTIRLKRPVMFRVHRPD